MCGIVGLYLKNPDLRDRLGSLFAPMLTEMTERGPDSAGLAVYRDRDRTDLVRVTVRAPGTDWHAVGEAASADLGIPVAVTAMATHAVLEAAAAAEALRGWAERCDPPLRVTSSGTTLEIYKEIGLPAAVLEQFGVPQMSGTHMIGHTRMATESAVTTEGGPSVQHR